MNKPELAKKCYTFDLYFLDQYGCDVHSLKDKTIFIDELSVVPLRWVTLVYQAFSIYHNQVFMFGDSNQCNSVESTKVFYDYLSSVAVSEMCPTQVKMKNKPECSRYDTQTKEFLDKFLQTYKIEETMPAPLLSYTNICYLNKTRRRITNDCYYRSSAGRDSMLVRFRYQGRLEKSTVSTDMPLLVTKNMRQLNLFNNQECKINTFDESTVTVEDGEYRTVTMKLSYSQRGRPPIFINESVFYSLVLSPKLETAEKFKHWVTSQVLPSIRKYGQYKLFNSPWNKMIMINKETDLHYKVVDLI